MTTGKKGKRIKLYMLITLSILFVVVGYFRFFQKKDAPAVVLSPLNTPAVQSVVPRDGGNGGKGAPENVQTDFAPIRQPAQNTIRNIFVPGKSERMAKPQAGDPSLSGFGSPLKLTGTIVGSGKPIAIINNQFLRTGQLIGGFRVVRITKNDVLLRSESQEILLKVLANTKNN
jgi:hypothetical protein